MKFLNLVSLLVGIILLSGFASAVVTETNIAIDSIVDSSNAVVSTSGELAGYEVYGYNCVDSSCSSSSGDFMINPGSTSTSRYVITYPTVLAAPKYAFFFVKPGYLPFEAVADYAGNVAAPDYSFNLAKRDSCSVPATVALTNIGSGAVDVEVSYDAPFTHGGPISFVPTALQGYYESPITFTAIVSQSGVVVSSVSSSEDVEFSTSDLKRLSFTGLIDGDYDVAVSVTTTDDRCILAPPTLLSSTFTSTGNPPVDTTPPADVSNVIITSLGTESFTVNWDNPSDLDLEGVLIYLDGSLITQVSGNSYTFTGLTPGQTYDVGLQTIDTSGNFNEPGIHVDVTTLTVPDTTPPASVTNLRVVDRGTDFIVWEWDQPTDADFSHNILWLDGVQLGFMNSFTTFHAGGLDAGTLYEVGVQTVDQSGNVNPIIVLDSEFTLFDNGDTTPPGPVRDLNAHKAGEDFVSINWINPIDADFDSVLIFVDGRIIDFDAVPGLNVSHTIYGLEEDSKYEIILKTVDLSGNIGEPGVSIVVYTAESDDDSRDRDNNDRRRNRNLISDTADEPFETKELNLNDFITQDSEILTISADNDSSDRKVSGWVWFFVLINFLVLLVVVLVVEMKR